jgi:hypothetical protein
MWMGVRVRPVALPLGNQEHPAAPKLHGGPAAARCPHVYVKLLEVLRGHFSNMYVWATSQFLRAFITGFIPVTFHDPNFSRSQYLFPSTATQDLDTTEMRNDVNYWSAGGCC